MDVDSNQIKVRSEESDDNSGANELDHGRVNVWLTSGNDFMLNSWKNKKLKKH